MSLGYAPHGCICPAQVPFFINMSPVRVGRHFRRQKTMSASGSDPSKRSPWFHQLGWWVAALLGAWALGVVALSRGETINALWVVIAAVCVYLIGYRYYSLFIADRVLGLDGTRMTPAWKHNDGLDFVPTNEYVLFGHHFTCVIITKDSKRARCINICIGQMTVFTFQMQDF